MYSTIGKILFFFIIISFILSSIALVVSKQSLKRSVYLAGFFANVLDFFYLPLRQLFLKFSDTRILDKWMASLKNRAYKSAFSKTKKKSSPGSPLYAEPRLHSPHYTDRNPV